ncbi:nucleoside-diphosphate sugar epimerase [Cohnella sp. CFH 77786]|uniref:nucleoside-diphosphate sugar epimerase n=1 Tax=Cohnella sp. CFH 77786 TaxID=2662265 RepID=UPI001C608128|nr:nucleoside-diphosphate sugar epimerase [Cohnella sp. CFH 77786]MBW5447383.1 nucleoside-diphosphate sugar epimerase [Cohnella sp. CFH 77786]
MQKIMTDIVVQLSQSHQQMARILEAKRQVTVRSAELAHSIPDVHPELGGIEGLLEGSSQLTKSVVAYLNSLAELEEAVAESLTNVVKATQDGGDEE